MAKVGFKSFLNITPTLSFTPVSGPNVQQEFSLILDENPLADMVELPSDAVDGGLWFSNVLCGVLRGALEMVRSVSFISMSYFFSQSESWC